MWQEYDTSSTGYMMANKGYKVNFNPRLYQQAYELRLFLPRQLTHISTMLSTPIRTLVA